MSQLGDSANDRCKVTGYCTGLESCRNKSITCTDSK